MRAFVGLELKSKQCLCFISILYSSKVIFDNVSNNFVYEVTFCQMGFFHCGLMFGLKNISDFGFWGLGFSTPVTAILNEHFYWDKMADT